MIRFLSIGAACLCAGVLTSVAGAQAQQSTARDWSGFNVGVNAGGAWGNSYLTTAVAAPGNYFVTSDPGQIQTTGAGSMGSSGFTGGVQGGYTWQTGSLLIGVEGDAGVMSLNATRTAGSNYLSQPANRFVVSQTMGADWIATLRPKIGWAVGDAAVYGTGGIALTTLKFDAQFNDNFGTFASSQSSARSTTIGWVLGAGMQYALGPQWSVKAEYLHVDFGSVSVGSPLTADGWRREQHRPADEFRWPDRQYRAGGCQLSVLTPPARLSP